MNRTGFHFTFEATITLLFVLSFIAVLHFPQPYNMDSLFLKQKQHDLLSVWLISRNFNIEEMENDFRFVFPATDGFIEINGKKKEIGKQTTEIRIENAAYLDESMELRTVSIGIYR